MKLYLKETLLTTEYKGYEDTIGNKILTQDGEIKCITIGGNKYYIDYHNNIIKE